MTKLPATPTTVIRPEWYMTFEKVSISVYFGFCTTWDWWGGIVLAIAQSWHQSWWIINIFSFNFSLSPISLYLFIINFICCEYLSYLRRSSLAFTHALALSPSQFGKNKEKCMPPHSNVFQLLRDEYESNTLQIFIEYRTNDNWIHDKYEGTIHIKAKCTKRKVLPPSKAEHFPHFGGFVRP